MIYTGRLRFLGWERPWLILTDNNEEFNIWLVVEPFFKALNGRGVDYKLGYYSIEITADDHSLSQLYYAPDDYLFIDDECAGCSNLHAYLETCLCFLNGRIIQLDINEKSFHIFPDESEKVFGLRKSGSSQFCFIEPGKEKEICKIGQGDDCCAFVMHSPDNGFVCAKFDAPTTHEIFNRLALGTLKAKRLGNCELLKRE